jgi:hypothetical protein
VFNYLVLPTIDIILAASNFSILVHVRDVFERRILVRFVPMNKGEIMAQGRTILWSVVALIILVDFNL